MLFLLLFAQPEPVSLQIERTDGVPAETTREVLQALDRSVERWAGARLRFDLEPFPACTDRRLCLREWFVAGGSSSIVLLSLFGGVSRSRVIAERIQRGQEQGRRVVRDLPAARSAWDPLVEELAHELFAEGELRVNLVAPAPVQAEPPRVIPLILAGGAALSALSAAGFTVSSVSARQELPETVLSREEYEPLRSRADTHAAAAIILGGSAIVLGIGALIVAFSD